MTSVYGCSWAIGAKCMAIGEDDTHDAPLEVFIFFIARGGVFWLELMSAPLCA